MKITLVRAATSIGANEIRSGAAAPLGLAYLAGNLLAAGYDVWAVDAVGESLSQYAAVPEAPGIMRHGLTDEQVVERIPKDTGLIGVACMFSTEWPFAKSLMNAIRQRFPQVKIIAGGEHIAACAEFNMRDCPALDYCALGEGEGIIVD